MSVVKIGLNQTEELVVYTIHSDLAAGSLKIVRAKFARAVQEEALQRVVDELDPEVPGRKLYLGNWRNGEIEIEGLQTIIQNKFWMEVVYKVLFPPKKGQTEPSRGTYRSVRWNAGVVSGVAVLALTREGDIVVIKEFKHAIRSWATHIMRGVRLISESLRACGLREAAEEAGVKTTADSHVHDLGTIYPDSGALQSKPRLLLVTNVEVDRSKVNTDVSEAIAGTLVLTPKEYAALLCTPKLLQPDDADPIDEDPAMADAFTEAAFFRAVNAGFIKL